ncbi:MAG: hypothetical protein ABEJ36_04185 [Candidatus Nanosalina sp.]
MARRKGFQMSINVVIAVVIAVIFVAVLIAGFTGVFQKATKAALGML